ncbi:MAG: alpha/beta hydrolase [Lentisphaerae bacterium]|nr:alpha/beta hydrolase [Lentisphaerota bacterium]
MKCPWDKFALPDTELFEPFQIINYGKENDPFQTLYLTLPKGKKNLPLVIFFHGGGMTGGGRECPDALFSGEYAVVEPRYRISPAVTAPAHMEDAAAAIAWCFEHAQEYGFDTSRVFVGGMSAGAYLAAITVMNPAFLAPYNLSYKSFAGLVLISGQMTTHFRVKADLGKNNGPYNPLVDEYAPFSFLSVDLPPILLVTGEPGLDMPARPEENAFFAASLKAMGHPFVRCFSLQGHGHVPAFYSCNHLVTLFLNDVLNPQK